MNTTAGTFEHPTARQEPDRPSRLGFGGAVGTALAVVLADPRLWLLGTAGLMLRGGWLVLGIPIWAVPSPVEVTTLVGPDAFTAAGPSARLVAIVSIGATLVVAAIAASAVAAAWVELDAFERFAVDPEVRPLLGERVPDPPHGRRRLVVLIKLVSVEAAVAVPAAVAIAGALIAMAGSLQAEIELPTAHGLPLLFRIATLNVVPIGFAVGLVVVADTVAAIMIRRVLVRRFRLVSGPAWKRSLSVRAPDLRIVGATFLCGWAATAVLFAPPLAAVLLAWSGVRAAFLSPPSAGDPGLVLGWALVTVLFVALWCAAALLGGIASAFRAALWSAVSLR